jgi:hypothetical protein
MEWRQVSTRDEFQKFPEMWRFEKTEMVTVMVTGTGIGFCREYSSGFLLLGFIL